MKRNWPILMLFFLFNSCFDQNDCIITATNLIKIDFATKAGAVKKVAFLSVTQDSLYQKDALGNIIGRDLSVGFPYFQTIVFSSVQLPVDAEHDTSYYTLRRSDSVTLKLAVSHTKFSRVISNKCGAFRYYKDLKVLYFSGNDPLVKSDSTRVLETQLFNSVTTNLVLYF